MHIIKQLAISALFLIVGAGLYISLSNQKELYQSLATVHALLKEHKSQKKETTQVVERVVAAQPWSDVQKLANDTVVQIIAQTAEINLLKPYETPRQGGGFGSGFFISNKGEIITNVHVVDQAQAVWIKIPSLGKAILPVKIVGKAPERDLALLQITEEGFTILERELGHRNTPFLQLGDSDLVHRADEVLALGYPLGQSSLKSTSGVVSGREDLGGKHYIQISSPINPGSSGGPSLNNVGQVIGITVAGIVSAQNVGYIIPVNELKMILEDLKTKKLLRRPFLGVLIGNASYDLAKYLGNPVPSGCYVIDTHPYGPLAKAGIKKGDMLYEINGLTIDEFGDLRVPWSEEKIAFTDYIARLKEGQNVTVKAYRKGKEINISFAFDTLDLAPIRKIIIGEDPLDYEIFGGMLFQPLNLNLVQALVQNNPHLIKYADFKNQSESAIVITHIMPSSIVDRLVVVQPGAIISKVDNTPVKTMDELRSALKKALHKKRIVFETDEGALFVVHTHNTLTDESRLAHVYHYRLSPFIEELVAHHKKTTDAA